MKISGQLDTTGCPTAEDALMRVVERHQPACLVLELSAVTSLDAAGLALLVRIRRVLRERGGRLTLSACSPPVTSALGFTRLHRLFDM